MNPAANELAPLIRALSSPDSAVRERAGVEIFRAGCEIANSATQSWFLDPKLATYFISDRSGIPELTVGLAVRPQTFEQIRAACGSPSLANVPPDQDACEFELQFPNGAHLDVLTTTAPSASGAMARFLKTFGETVQQVEISVTDVDGATAILREQFGATSVYPTTRPGANGTRVNFFLVPTSQDRKVLIELVETPQRNERESLK